MAAMELAPSKKKSQTFTEQLPIEATEEPSPAEEATATESNEMIRIRILQSLPEPIMLGDGLEINLEQDDIHFIDKDTADWLVESGVAEVENL